MRLRKSCCAVVLGSGAAATGTLDDGVVVGPCQAVGRDCAPSGYESTYEQALRVPSWRGQQLVERCPDEHAVTAAGKHDGFGAQFAATISVFGYAIITGQTYCTTEWQRMEHLANNVTAMDWFRFVGGHLYGPPATAHTTKKQFAHGEADNQYAHHPDIAARVRAAYWATPKPRLVFYEAAPDEIHLAVHVRRGDVKYPSFRYNKDSQISNCVNAIVPLLREEYPQRSGVRVHVFSEGNESAFHFGFNASMHLSTPEAEAFHHLVAADALVIATSTFSWTAAFISVGRVFSMSSKRLNHRIERC